MGIYRRVNPIGHCPVSKGIPHKSGGFMKNDLLNKMALAYWNITIPSTEY
jgi:hypothetical protein